MISQPIIGLGAEQKIISGKSRVPMGGSVYWGRSGSHGRPVSLEKNDIARSIANSQAHAPAKLICNAPHEHPRKERRLPDFRYLAGVPRVCSGTQPVRSPAAHRVATIRDNTADLAAMADALSQSPERVYFFRSAARNLAASALDSWSALASYLSGRLNFLPSSVASGFVNACTAPGYSMTR